MAAQGNRKIMVRAAFTLEGDACCPNCHCEKTVLVWVANYKDKIAYQCSNCSKIVWGYYTGE